MKREIELTKNFGLFNCVASASNIFSFLIFLSDCENSEKVKYKVHENNLYSQKNYIQ